MCLEKEVLEASTQAVQVAPWWIQIDGASWKSPEGGKDRFTDDINRLINLFIDPSVFLLLGLLAFDVWILIIIDEHHQGYP